MGVITTDEITRALQPARRFSAIPFGGLRAIAALIDLALISVLQVGLSQVFGIVHPVGAMYAVVAGDGVYLFVGKALMLTWSWLVIVVVVYFTLLEALFHSTPGKALVGLRVVTMTGTRPTLRAVIIRNLLRPLDAWPAVYFVGAVSAAWSGRGQRVGDRAAGTLVVPAAMVRDAGMPRGRLLARLAVVAGLLALLAAGCLAFDYYGRPPLVVQGWANANNVIWFNPAWSGAPPLCGVWQPLPASEAPGGSFGYVLPRQISVYALGSPTWEGDTITYPVSLQLVPLAETAHGGTYQEPAQVPTLAGADVYNGVIALRWRGFIGGGWRVSGGELDC
jgi:uncharacterized RDD family membrane protein YckC